MVARVSAPLVRVLEVILRDPSKEIYGYPLIKDTGLQSGTVYPLLARLEQSRWLTSEWDQPETGPRRRKYRLTAEGQREAQLILAQYRHESRTPATTRPRPAWGH